MYIRTLVCTCPTCQGCIITVVVMCFLVHTCMHMQAMSPILQYLGECIAQDENYQEARDYHRDYVALACRACTDKGGYVHAQMVPARSVGDTCAGPGGGRALMLAGRAGGWSDSVRLSCWLAADTSGLQSQPHETARLRLGSHRLAAPPAAGLVLPKGGGLG